MTVTEHLMRPGSGSLQFRTDTPVSITRAIMALVDENAGGIGAHVVVTPSPINPALVGDTAALALASYTGRITARPSRTSLEFVGLGAWLDTYLDAAIASASRTPAQWLTALLANDLSAGSVVGGSSVTKEFPAHITTRREALDAVAGLGGWNYRIRPNFTVDAQVPTTLFRSPPVVVVTRRSEGTDATLRGVDGSMIDQRVNVANTATKAVALAEGEGLAIVKGTATTAVSLKAPKGSAPELVTVFSAPGEESANANAAAQGFLNLQGMRREVAVSSRTHQLTRHVVPGDYVYVYDPATGLVDAATQVRFRGEMIFPATVRLLALTWPIEEGYGVYIRPNAAAPTWIDVTSWIEWESGDTWWTVGDWSPSSYGRVNRSDPEVEARIGVGDTTWANVTLASANWSGGPIQWRKLLGRVELRGSVTRTVSAFAAGGTLINLATNGIPEPPFNWRPPGFGEVVAATPDLVPLGWFIDTATDVLRTTTSTHNLAIGDQVHADGMWWPIA